MVEFILALGLSAAVMGVLHSIVFGAARTWKANRADAESFQEVRVTLQKIEEDLQNAVPFGPSPFMGDAKEISLIARVELHGAGESSGRKALARIRYLWGKDQHGEVALLRQWKAFVPENGPWVVEGEDVFPSSITDISIAYAYRKESSFETFWLDSWRFRQIPEGVRIALSVSGFGLGPGKRAPFVKTVHILCGSLGQGV